LTIVIDSSVQRPLAFAGARARSVSNWSRVGEQNGAGQRRSQAEIGQAGARRSGGKESHPVLGWWPMRQRVARGWS